MKWQNIKDNDIEKLIKLIKHMLIACVSKSKEKRELSERALCVICSATSTLARLIIFHQLEEQLYSNLLHMLMNQLREGAGGGSRHQAELEWRCESMGR